MNKKQNENRIKALDDDRLEQVVGGAIPGDFSNDGKTDARPQPGSTRFCPDGTLQ